MKGLLSQFEGRVNNVINSTYKVYGEDFIKIIGHLPSENSNLKKRNRPHQDDLIKKIEQEFQEL